MIEITSIKTGKVQIIPDETWLDIVKRGWGVRFTKRPIVEKKLERILPPEIKTKTVKKDG